MNRFYLNGKIWSLLFLICTLTLLTLSCSSHKDFPTFILYQIDTIGNPMGQTDLTDMDNDGDPVAVGKIPGYLTSVCVPPVIMT